jgi:predicted membrane-bound mannosyltransferase
MVACGRLLRQDDLLCPQKFHQASCMRVFAMIWSAFEVRARRIGPWFYEVLNTFLMGALFVFLGSIASYKFAVQETSQRFGYGSAFLKV